MHVVVIHDSEGNIESLIASPPDSPVAYGSIRPGQFVTEVDIPDIDAELDAEEIGTRLSDLMENFKIEKASSTGSLTKRQDSSTGVS